MERIICAAIYVNDGKKHKAQPLNIDTGIVIGGFRHGTCRPVVVAMYYPNWQTDFNHDAAVRVKVLNLEIQGFITNTHRFVDRKEALIIAKKAKQLLIRVPKTKTELFSEDIY
jgi:hypothetical protein